MVDDRLRHPRSPTLLGLGLARSMVALGFVAMAASGCIGGDPSLSPPRYCEATEESAESRGLDVGEIYLSNDGCSPGERVVCVDEEASVFREVPCP